ncbi:hypothetical protein ACIPZ5_17710 [Pseudomonas sp. NPDC089428]|uniref:hypothetical protein n=1 Tax=Pseudomonas sp. NPDC089428 TaxID=3364467 RepID=UPI0038115E08
MARPNKFAVSRFERHIEVLQATGLHCAIYTLRGYQGRGKRKPNDVNLAKFTSYFNDVVRRTHPEVYNNYHFFWFRTGDEITVCFSGNMFLLDAVERFMSNTVVNVSIAHRVTELCSGRDKSRFNGVLAQRLTLYSPTPRKRSYGGCHLLG